MYKLPLIALLLTFTQFSAFASDNDRIDHFKGTKANSLVEARELLSTYNNKLMELQKKAQLESADLQQIHLATYTLENQIAYMIKDLTIVAEKLEELHLTSETGDAAKTSKKLENYLDHASQHQSNKK